MGKTVKIKYDSDTFETQITVGERVFDTSRINGKEISDWAYPFIVKNIRWNGIYDELRSFVGETEEFQIQFDGAEKELEVLRTALKDTAVRVAGMNNKVVILYKREPLTTKITVNGKVFDTSKLQNRYIDEWISPFQFRDVKWDGIFQELERFIGTDLYTIQFVGEQEDMKELMKTCLENVSMTYRVPSGSTVGLHGANLKEKGMEMLSGAQSAAKGTVQSLHGIDTDVIKSAVSKGVQSVQNMDADAVKQKTGKMLKTAKEMRKDDWIAFFKKQWKKIVPIVIAVILVLVLLIKLIGAIFGGSTLTIEPDTMGGAMACEHECKAGSVGFLHTEGTSTGFLYFSAGDHTTVYLIESEDGVSEETTAAESEIYERNSSSTDYDTKVKGKDVDGDGCIEFTISEFTGVDYKKACTIKCKY
ncbi:hypothetical protein [Ruminococcus sp.]|uniref:hypothetical protein n=1 Tax=Ruminococcus sp. TaxID=41978 RepID=UPI0025D2824C|nr:hypothetical protein [Ruminococcus sp.]